MSIPLDAMKGGALSIGSASFGTYLYTAPVAPMFTDTFWEVLHEVLQDGSWVLAIVAGLLTIIKAIRAFKNKRDSGSQSSSKEV